MDVLRPNLIYVEGRCYRINDPDSDFYNTKQSGVDWDDSSSNYGVTDCTGDEPCDGEEEFEITCVQSGRFKAAFHVARVYYAPIIGQKGQTKKRLEEETKTIIIVPRQPQDNKVVITGPTKQAVASACRRIHLLISSFRRKQQFTHFLCIPMNSPPVKERFLQFKREVLEQCGSARGLEESIFQDPEKLHLTLCTLVLTDNVERAQAAQMLEKCKTDVIDPLMEGNTILILLSGVEYMNDDPSEVDVLYAKVFADQILQNMADNIVDYCANTGLTDKQFEKVKLHVTIMNTLFRDKKPESNGRSRTRETFNASPILEKFGDFEFGEVDIESIHLSTRFTKAKDGFYQPSAQISLLLSTN